VPNGIIVATEKGEGLVPTRELSLAPGADHRRSYPVETELRVVVVNRDANNGKLRLRVGRVAQVEELNNYREFSAGESPEKGGESLGSLGELMSKKFPGLAARAAKDSAKKAPSPAPAPKPVAPQAGGASPEGAHQDHQGVRRRQK
jgi:hypothetical protein